MPNVNPSFAGSWGTGKSGEVPGNGLFTNQQRHLSIFYQPVLLQEHEQAEHQPSSPLLLSLPPHTPGAGAFHSFLPPRSCFLTFLPEAILSPLSVALSIRIGVA